MKKIHIKCSQGHRLFDTVDNSRLNIKIKCGNKKSCPHKATCSKETYILLGGEREEFSKQYFHQPCPACNKRLFDVTKDSMGIVQIKCDNCGKVVNISLGISA